MDEPLLHRLLLNAVIEIITFRLIVFASFLFNENKDTQKWKHFQHWKAKINRKPEFDLNEKHFRLHSSF